MKQEDSEMTTYYNYKERDPTIGKILLTVSIGTIPFWIPFIVLFSALCTVVWSFTNWTGWWLRKVSMGGRVLLKAYRQLISGLLFSDSKHATA